jgi:hypothetical protein
MGHRPKETTVNKLNVTKNSNSDPRDLGIDLSRASGRVRHIVEHPFERIHSATPMPDENILRGGRPQRRRVLAVYA